MKKRKLDLMTVLAVMIGMGVLVTGLAQGMMNDSQSKLKTADTGTAVYTAAHNR